MEGWMNMNYLVVLFDGMADYPLPELGNKTPLEVADAPNLKGMAKTSEVGMIKTVADGMKPGSDVANLSVLGYDPFQYYTGRSPLEAGSIGIDMKSTDISLRCNLVTLSDEPEYADKTILDYCADDISTAEAEQLVAYLGEKLNDDQFHFYSGVSYRHCLIWEHGTLDNGTLTPPHDITGKPIHDYVPAHPNAQKLYALMRKSYDLLKDHPVNQARVARGLRPANSIWLWGEGVRAELPNFKEKYGLDATMISAVDLLKGIGKFSGMEVLQLPNVTGYIDTDFDGKANAAIDAFKRGKNFVYIHVEAPDECGHRGEIQNKVRAIELIDEKIVGPVTAALRQMGSFRVLITPDHATPLSIRTHTNDPVPFMIYDSEKPRQGVEDYCERTAKMTGLYIDTGYTIMNHFLEK